MAAVSSSPRRPAGRIGLPHPAYWIWRRLTSVRWAAALILVAALFSAAGVIIPQVPPQLADIPEQVQQHIDAQRGTFGGATDALAEFPWLYDAKGGVFNLYKQPYWYALVALVAVAIAVCTVSRAAPIWRTVRRPPRRVNPAYFERARHRFALDLPQSAASGSPGSPNSADERAAALSAALRARRYRVERIAQPDSEPDSQADEQSDDAVDLFADRFGWTQLATFATHLALLLLLGATLVTKFGGEEYQFWVAEGESHPLFAPGAERAQIQIIVDDAIARFADDGQALDFRSKVRVAEGGAPVGEGDVTVNGPLHAAGYRVHQASYWEHGAALRIYDHASGQLVYSEAHFLGEQLVGPRVRIERGGAPVSEEVLGLQHAVAGDAPLGARYTLVPLAAERSLAVALIPRESPEGEVSLQFWYRLLNLDLNSAEAQRLTLAQLGVDQEPPVAPRVRLTGDDGAVLVDGLVSLGLHEGDARLAALALPNGEGAAIGFRETAGERTFFYYSFNDEADRGILQAGESARLGGATLEYLGGAPDATLGGSLEAGQSSRVGVVELTYLGAESVFWATVPDLPGADGEALLALERFGQARTAEQFNAMGGEDVDLAVGTNATSAGGQVGRPARLVLGLGGGAARIELDEGQEIAANGYRYEFAGPREFTGLNVRRDPGGIPFWIGVALGVVGMSTTFFMPRRRVWARLTDERIALAGQAGHGVRLTRELEQIAREAAGAAAPAPAARARRLRNRFSDDYAGPQRVHKRK